MATTKRKSRRLKPKRRHYILLVLLIVVTLLQLIPSAGNDYAVYLYPLIARPLNWFSSLFNFALGDLFIVLSVAFALCFPFYVLFIRKHDKLRSLGYLVEFLLWLHVWFYLAWGLNYWQNDFYGRTGIAPAPYDENTLLDFADRYARQLNESYTAIKTVDPQKVQTEVTALYRQLSAEKLGVHPPLNNRPTPKTMLFTPLVSKVGVTGSMGPFFCEFTLNGDLQPVEYAATYAHEYAHLLGITDESEANLYAYLACTRSNDAQIRFSGYFSIYPHVVNDLHRLDEKEYARFIKKIRPEILDLYKQNRQYWKAKYSRFLGGIQDKIYDFYLRHHHMPSGIRTYGKVIGLLISYQAREKEAG